MPFLSGELLKNTLEKVLDDQYNPSSIKQAAYELSLGVDYYSTDSDGQIEILDDKKKIVEINAGQFCLLLTEETVTIPKDMMAFISIKANEKFKGLINVSGFHLDPGFHGRILFSVYNAGPSTISLEKGKKYFLMWLASLSEELSDNDAYNGKQNTHQGQNGIPTRYIDALKRGEIASPNALLKKIENNEHESSKRYVRHEVIAGVLLTLLIGIWIKVLSSENSYERGYLRRVKEESMIKEIRQAQYLTSDSNLIRIDSLNIKLERMKNNIFFIPPSTLPSK